MQYLRLLTIAATVSACAPTVGPECDEPLARMPVYDLGGTPAYVGQAYLNEACASCHGDGLPGRRGAPVGMDLGLPLVTAGEIAAADAQAIELRRVQRIVFEHRDLIYEQVLTGAMPPRNTIGTSTSRFVYHDGTPLPGLATRIGRELFRNWLACGSPVVEAQEARARACARDVDCAVTAWCDVERGACVGVGDVVEPRGVEFAPRWSEIHPFLEAGCATAECHDAESAQSGLDLSERGAAYAALTTGPPASGTSLLCSSWGDAPYVVPGAPDESLFYVKLFDREELPPGTTRCGVRMPTTAPLPDVQREAIRAWIAAGAMDD